MSELRVDIIRSRQGTSTDPGIAFDANGNFTFDGVATFSNGISTTDLTLTSGALQLPSYTTANLPSSPSNGQLVYNTTDNKVFGYVDGAWGQIAGGGGSAPGTVAYMAMSSAPDGWLKANGASISRTTYADLFAAIGTTWGGSGSNFNVPDLRGHFLRAWDDGRGTDSGRGFASLQDQSYQTHRHWISSMATDDRNITGTNGNGQEYGIVSDASSYSSSDRNKNTGRYTRNENGGSNETRPKNYALLACIKY